MQTSTGAPFFRGVRRAFGDAGLNGNERLASDFAWLPQADSAPLLAPAILTRCRGPRAGRRSLGGTRHGYFR
jgi:hypothetical protein